MDGEHYNSAKEIDTHNIFGSMQVEASDAWFKSQNKRTFVLSRSTFAGHGKFGQHWLGDNGATANYMGQSVIGIMQMNLFGVPFVGSDICGFSGPSLPELCARWHMVGAF